MDRIRAAIAALRGELAQLEPGAFSPDAAAALAEELAATENACGVAKVRMAARAASCGAHRKRGFADASDWVASATGSTIHEARRQLDTITAVEQCADTRDALINGEVSLAQAGEIAHAEAEARGCEEELLVLAKSGSLGAVRDRARSLRLEAVDREELYAKQRQARSFSHWLDGLGMVCGSFRLTPDVGVPFVNRIDTGTDRLCRAARRAGGVREPRAALAADAFVAMTATTGEEQTGATGLTRSDAAGVVVIDWPALVRGHVHPGERSHLVGGGPVPVRIAREMLANAFLKVVLTDGVEIQRVVHLGRHVPAALRTALELGPPPEFVGVTCSEHGCDRRYGLEWDHVDPVANGGVTSLENLKPKCGPHHWDKTARDRAAGLLGNSNRRDERVGGGGGRDRAPP